MSEEEGRYLSELTNEEFCTLARARRDQMKELIEMYSLFRNTSVKSHLNGEITNNRVKELSGRVEVFEQLLAEANTLGDSVLYFKESSGNLIYLMLDKNEIENHRLRMKEIGVAYI